MTQEESDNQLDDLVKKIKTSENQYVILANENNVFIPPSYLRFEDIDEDGYQFEKRIENMFPEYFI